MDVERLSSSPASSVIFDSSSLLIAGTLATAALHASWSTVVDSLGDYFWIPILVLGSASTLAFLLRAFMPHYHIPFLFTTILVQVLYLLVRSFPGGSDRGELLVVFLPMGAFLAATLLFDIQYIHGFMANHPRLAGITPVLLVSGIALATGIAGITNSLTFLDAYGWILLAISVFRLCVALMAWKVQDGGNRNLRFQVDAIEYKHKRVGKPVPTMLKPLNFIRFTMLVLLLVAFIFLTGNLPEYLGALFNDVTLNMYPMVTHRLYIIVGITGATLIAAILAPLIIKSQVKKWKNALRGWISGIMIPAALAGLYVWGNSIHVAPLAVPALVSSVTFGFSFSIAALGLVLRNRWMFGHFESP